MSTQRLALTAALQAVGDGSKAVLIAAGRGGLVWCDSAAAPVAGAPVHVLDAGEEILLPAGMKPYIGAVDPTYPGEAIFTIYP